MWISERVFSTNITHGSKDLILIAIIRKGWECGNERVFRPPEETRHFGKLSDRTGEFIPMRS
ncbi:hypothetical protein PLAN_60231 [Planktothrix rubescens CCAP 1459/22]|uniref:Uncharacterized protein n=1 Tax=Planktothrix rubescens CCAP 1459/22 TaxID=329571 RepID=A0A6J7ZTE0_PLARU|nr:hypothetical protein PLAN_60231 [Planktothrix rubescens NIVA-CYA 18]